MSTRRSLISLFVSIAALALPAAAAAQAPPPGPPPPPGEWAIAITAVDAGARTITGQVHCSPPEFAGRVMTYSVAPGVDMTGVEPKQVRGVVVDTSTDPDTVTKIDGEATWCAPAYGAGPPPGGGGPGGPGSGPGGPGGDPSFSSGFLNRVWKFVGAADGFSDGKLSFTTEKILNLPKKFRSDDDDLIDQDAIALVGASTRIFDDKGRRGDAGDLAKAERVRVHGKLLRPSKWQKDEDGEETPTIRAKKVYILG